jgi:tRNA pseudouridine55 synthase
MKKIEKGTLNETISPTLEDFPEGIVISLDKPYGWTSADAVRKIKFNLQRYFKSKNIKVGHAGTLDPLATGVLLICVGKATKKAEYLQAQAKEYIAEIRFGCTTPSYDLEKEIDQEFPFEHISAQTVENVLPQFIGKLEQIPPVFSAKLINGSRAYELARAGVQTEMKAASVEIYNATLLHFESPYAVIRISCSKGTYIRSFARDIGVALNSGAHLTNLKRVTSGEFKVENSITIEDFLKLFS